MSQNERIKNYQYEIDNLTKQNELINAKISELSNENYCDIKTRRLIRKDNRKIKKNNELIKFNSSQINTLETGNINFLCTYELPEWINTIKYTWPGAHDKRWRNKYHKKH